MKVDQTRRWGFLSFLPFLPIHSTLELAASSRPAELRLKRCATPHAISWF
jgi:hypothetical protein